MEKSRELPFERGVGDGWFSSTSGSVYGHQPLYVEKSNLPLSFTIGQGRAATYKSVPSWIGQQTFRSSERPMPQFNSCSNYKVKGVELPVTYCNCAHNRTNYYYWAEMTRLGVPVGTIGENATPSNPSALWRDVDDAQRRAWWSMQPRFEGEFQALNFLYELKDFKDICRYMFKPTDVINKVKSIKRRLTYAQKRVRQGSTSKNMLSMANAATKTAAEVWLTKVFAIDPTVRDLITLHGQLVTLVNQVQQEFFDRGKDVQSSHYTETISETSSFSIGKYNNQWKGTGSSSKVSFTATMQYRYEYEMRSWFDALKRYYGLNLNAGVVWEALPFSFLIDYFLKVGQAIDFMHTDPNVELRLMQYCESILSEATTGLHYVDWQKASVMINGGTTYGLEGSQAKHGQLIAGYHGSWYIRRVTSPNKGTALPRLSLPSDRQVTNIVALLRAMW